MDLSQILKILFVGYVISEVVEKKNPVDDKRERKLSRIKRKLAKRLADVEQEDEDDEDDEDDEKDDKDNSKDKDK